jgi:hypothetical protein
LREVDTPLSVDYYEYMATGSGGCVKYQGWEGELMPAGPGEPGPVPHGIYHAGFNTNYVLRAVPTVIANTVFNLSVEPTVNVNRLNGGAGNAEYGVLPLANFGGQKGPAMRVNVRIRCE